MKRETTTIAIVSGKGGVGKSVVAANLAETLAWAGHAVALLDADAGQGAQSILFNEGPAAGLLDWAEGRAAHADCFHETLSGVTLAQAALSPVEGAPAALFAALDETLAALRERHRFVLIDAPAGVDSLVRWALDRADFGLVVVVGEPTAIADAYRLAKTVWSLDESYPFALVVNYADGEADADGIADRFARVTRQFTGQAPAFLGWVPFSPLVRQSVAAQTPAVRTYPELRPAFSAIARVIDRGRQATPSGAPALSPQTIL